MAKATRSVPQNTYAPGTREVELPNLTTDDNGIDMQFTRVSWPVNGGVDVVTGSIDGTDDNDATRYNLTVFSFPGGDQTNPRTGLPVTYSGVHCYWPEAYVNGVTVPKRPGRVFVTITNPVTITTAITLTGL